MAHGTWRALSYTLWVAACVLGESVCWYEGGQCDVLRKCKHIIIIIIIINIIIIIIITTTTTTIIIIIVTIIISTSSSSFWFTTFFFLYICCCQSLNSHHQRINASRHCGYCMYDLLEHKNAWTLHTFLLKLTSGFKGLNYIYYYVVPTLTLKWYVYVNVR